jgi:SAM-dependent methyltransferase
MSAYDDLSGIADANRPSAGRIYDYLLGGNHNFEIDREAAKKVVEIGPFFPRMFRLIRWFLGEATRRLSAEGFNHFLDFASGLPTVDHIHQIAPEGTKVIYSDIDPVTVAYAQQIISGNSNIRYLQCDAAQPETLLNSPEIEELFGENRKLAIGFNGIAWFLPDEAISRSLKVIYNWAAPGSKLFMCDSDAPDQSEQSQRMVDLYENLQRLHIRSLETVKKLVRPWKLLDPGFRPLEEWVELEKNVTEEMSNAFGGNLIAGVLEKE